MTALQLADEVTHTSATAGLRVSDVAAELKQIMRLAGRDPEALEGLLPRLSQFARVAGATALDESARVHCIVHHLVPEYLERLPAGRDCRAIRELLAWENSDGELQSLTTRYHKAAAHLVGAASDFGRRQEPRLLRECARRFIALDHEDRVASPARVGDGRTADTAAASTRDGIVPGDVCDPYGGIVCVHRNLDYHRLIDLIADGRQITILNTWIPGLDILADSLEDALSRGSDVSILLLDPASQLTHLGGQGLHDPIPGRLQHDRVGPRVRHCLDTLAHMSRSVDVARRRNLRIRLYDSLPSISAYAIDERIFIGFFMHGQLAVKSVQIEVLGRTSIMGQLVSREIETLSNLSSGLEQGSMPRRSRAPGGGRARTRRHTRRSDPAPQIRANSG